MMQSFFDSQNEKYKLHNQPITTAMSSTEIPVIEGDVDYDVPSAGKPVKTHYWVHGDLKSGKTPLVALHGGPGSTHDYIAVISDITKAHGIPVILYDQIGNGRSTHLPEKLGVADFWTVQLFIDELDSLLKHLGVQDNFDLYGHSWGGMLSIAFAVRQPKGLRKLILASAIPKMQDYVASTVKLRSTLPQDVQDTLTKHLAGEMVDPKELQAAEGAYYGRFVISIESKEMTASIVQLMSDPTVHFTMLGPNVFTVVGPLKDFDLIPELHKINVPTLLTNGRWDGVQDSVVAPMFKHIAKTKWAHFAASSHAPHLEERERYMEVVGQFLTSGY
ncbi:hypothetical protein EIP91_003986 [Steccherinum ochraceum]|uniref:AB hydrolase-1 domain-containing protein n=1 Tax=Steccherinum ochraceum TaxID=92696 RepID=A0A4R0RL69_9APHY|nr:hypothetical protein EIP91_003986 [Steccherinum ochraceum]